MSDPNVSDILERLKVDRPDLFIYSSSRVLDFVKFVAEPTRELVAAGKSPTEARILAWVERRYPRPSGSAGPGRPPVTAA